MALDDSALAPKLDPVRERFVQEYHATGNASEAFRRARPHAAKWKENSVNSRACQMLSEAKVQQRLEELQAEAAVGTTSPWTASRRAGGGSREAHATGQISAAVSAIMGKAKLHGLVVDKQEQKRVAGEAT